MNRGGGGEQQQWPDRTPQPQAELGCSSRQCGACQNLPSCWAVWPPLTSPGLVARRAVAGVLWGGLQPGGPTRCGRMVRGGGPPSGSPPHCESGPSAAGMRGRPGPFQEGGGSTSKGPDFKVGAEASWEAKYVAALLRTGLPTQTTRQPMVGVVGRQGDIESSLLPQLWVTSGTPESSTFLLHSLHPQGSKLPLIYLYLFIVFLPRPFP